MAEPGELADMCEQFLSLDLLTSSVSERNTNVAMIQHLLKQSDRMQHEGFPPGMRSTLVELKDEGIARNDCQSICIAPGCDSHLQYLNSVLLSSDEHDVRVQLMKTFRVLFLPHTQRYIKDGIAKAGQQRICMCSRPGTIVVYHVTTVAEIEQTQIYEIER